MVDQLEGLVQRFGFCLLWMVLFAGFNTSHASDVSRELDYQKVMGDLKLKDLLELNAGGQKFAALFNEAQKNPDKRAVLILHDMDGYPDQQPVIRNLRTELPEHQWSALSLQMPLREAGAGIEDYFTLFPEAVLRIQAGIDFLTKQELKNIVVVGYGLGGQMAVYAVAEKKLAAKALIAISLPVLDDLNPPTLEMLKKITMPILDIYAERDAENVSLTAKDRRLATKENSTYRQLRLAGEDHNFQHEQGLLVKRIYSWLSRTVIAQDAQ